MAYEHKEGSGALFRNNKEGNANRPDLRGDAMINGVLVEISAWGKVRDNGEKWLSLSIKPKVARKPEQPPQRQQPERGKVLTRQPQPQGSGFDDMNSDIPF